MITVEQNLWNAFIVFPTDVEEEGLIIAFKGSLFSSTSTKHKLEQPWESMKHQSVAKDRRNELLHSTAAITVI